MSGFNMKLLDAIAGVAEYDPDGPDYLDPNLATSAVLGLLKAEGYAKRADVLEEAVQAVFSADAYAGAVGSAFGKPIVTAETVRHVEAIRALATPSPKTKESD